MKKTKPELLIFDIGGVLVELTGVPMMIEWVAQSGTELTSEELWQKWIQSPTVRLFEKGGSPPYQFAIGMVNEFQLPVSPEEFLVEFITWPKGPYPGMLELLEKLKKTLPVGCMSNTNELHWPHVQKRMGFKDKFDYSFPSHITGFLKPDREAFEHIIETTEFAAGAIYFFDDNKLNVDGAKKAGLTAYLVNGPEHLVEELIRLKLIQVDPPT